MKNLILLFSVCFLLACGNKKAVVEDAAVAEEVEEVVEETADDVSDEEKALTAISKAFTKAIVDQDLSDIKKYYSTVEVAKTLAEEQTKGKTDEQIKKEMLDPLVQRFESNIKDIQAEMTVHKVDKSTFSYIGHEYAENDDPGVIPRVLSIKYSNSGDEISIPITIAKVGMKYYVFEVLNTHSIFH